MVYDERTGILITVLLFLCGLLLMYYQRRKFRSKRKETIQ